MLLLMSDVTSILEAAAGGDPSAAEKLLPLVYDELRKLAAARLAQEKPGQTLQATALVHEAYLRLVGGGARDLGREAREENSADRAPTPSPQRVAPRPSFRSRGHFFGAAAEAMRRILVESARRKLCLRHGGEFQRHELDSLSLASPKAPEELLALSEALDLLAAANTQAAELVKLRFFAGLTNEQAAAALGISPRKANQIWTYAKAWLLESLSHEPLD